MSKIKGKQAEAIIDSLINGYQHESDLPARVETLESEVRLLRNVVSTIISYVLKPDEKKED